MCTVTSGDVSQMELLEEPRLKRRKPGIVYLSAVPVNMNVSNIREYFSKFAEIGRLYLQASQNKPRSKKKGLQFTEGWIEFASKRKAKAVVLNLNNQQVGGKKSNPQYDMLWNIKYLPRFKWAYLKQRLEYEREVHRQRLNAEVSQVRKETDHFIRASDKSKQLSKLQLLQNVKNIREVTTNEAGLSSHEDNLEHPMFVFKQKLTEEEVLRKKAEKKERDEKYRSLIEKRKKKKQLNRRKEENIDDFLSTVFVGKSVN